KKRKAEEISSAFDRIYTITRTGNSAFLFFEPVGVYLNKVLPLLRSRRLFEDRFDRTDGLTSPTVDALLRIDIELVFFLEFFGLVFGRMDAIDRTDIDTSGILHAYAGLSNDIGHLSFLLSRTVSLLANRLAQVNKIYAFSEAYLDRSLRKCYTGPTPRNEMIRKLSRIHVPRPLLAIAIIALGVAFPAGAATIDDALKNLRSLSPAQRKAVLEENARKEGELVWYTSMSLTDFPKIVGAFEKAVPYARVRANRLTQSTVITKIDTEARAGLFAVDIVGSEA